MNNNSFSSATIALKSYDEILGIPVIRSRNYANSNKIEERYISIQLKVNFKKVRDKLCNIYKVSDSANGLRTACKVELLELNRKFFTYANTATIDAFLLLRSNNFFLSVARHV